MIQKLQNNHLETFILSRKWVKNKLNLRNNKKKPTTAVINVQ